MKKKLIAMLLISTAILTATGCFGSQEVEEDEYLTLTVSDADLVDEEEVVEEAKDAKDLWKAVEIITVGSQVYVKIEPGENLKEEGAWTTTMYFNDANYLQGLVNVKDDVYFEADITDATDKDRVTANIVSYLRDLDNPQLIELVKATQQEVQGSIEEEPEEKVEEGQEGQEGQLPADDGQQPQEGADGTEEEGEDDGPDPFDLFEQYESGQMGEENIYLKEEEREALIDQYLELRHFAIGKNIVLYDTKGGKLGSYSTPQLNSYYYKLKGEAAPYELVGGYIKASDLLPETTYTTKAADAKNGSFEIRFKNDTNNPTILYVVTKEGEQVIPLFDKVFTVTGYYPKGEWSAQGLVTEYNFRIATFETDEAMFQFMTDNAIPGGLKLSTVQPNEKGKYVFDSEYDAFINDTDDTLQIQSDTKNVEILEPGQAIGVSKDKQDYFTMTKIELEEEE